MSARRLIRLVALTAAAGVAAAVALPGAEAAVPTIRFAPAAYYKTGQSFDSPSADENGIAAGDFNGDGKQDVVEVAQWEGNSVVIQYGNGNGTFQSPGHVITLGSAIAVENVVTGKFTSSGRTDIVVLTAYGFYVLRNDGGGVFTQGPLTVLEQAPFQDTAVAGDFNGDGKLDLEIKDVTGIQAELGNGDGTFTAGPRTTIPGSIPPGVSGITIANVNGDSILDLFAADAASQQVFSLRGLGSGGFAVAGSAVTPLVPGGVAAVHDTPGGLDNAVVFREFDVPGTSAAEFDNTGSGGLGAVKIYNGGYTPDADETGDFNGDGATDVVSTDTVGSQLVILGGDGNGGLVQSGGYSAGIFPQDPAVADFNGDGKPDIAAATFCPTIGILTAQTCLAVLINRS
ncbi:VCBS repeat-containing protein [Jatrophihabitans sp.]|uniref:FG-GAP repeat domain-containing protein n=1 Tax=Jatrophihabitans sp. TaxID=1932789 RepID=UPI0030C6C3FA|nr:repeat-containing protein [Jatrophihabitans sp.]